MGVALPHPLFPTPPLPCPLAPLPPYAATSTGREALRRILAYLQPGPDAEVWISTTLGMHGLRVSPCVTATVMQFCRFAARPGLKTAAALVIHDYGVPHPGLPEIAAQCRRQGWPLIEDAAHAFASVDASGRRMGTTGNFALFSLPKFFAVRRGGLVAGLPEANAGPADGEVAAELRHWLSVTAEIVETRRRNWRTLDAAFNQLGLGAALPLTKGSVPSLYVLQTSRQFTMLRALRRAGIESGPDVHCDYVLLPCHQNVRHADLATIVTTVAEATISKEQQACRSGQPSRLSPFRVRLTPDPGGAGLGAVTIDGRSDMS